MTDKEQITCKYKFQDKERFNGEPYCTCFCELCKDLPICDDNCQIYEDDKQLARKTQELETICKAFDIEYGHNEEAGAIIGRCNKLIEKEKELEKYKQSLDEKNKFLQDLGISASGEFKRIKFYIESLKNKYNEKVKECEELKKQLETSEKWRIKAESLNENFELKNTCYRKALEEIEKVINNILNSCLGRNTVSCRSAHNVCGDLININDIINKAKGEGICNTKI